MSPDLQKNISLPPLREELQLLPGAPTLNGKPTWLVFDPVEHRYFQIDRGIYDLLHAWSETNSLDALHQVAAKEFHDDADAIDAQIKRLLSFVDLNNLAITPMSGEWQVHHKRDQERKKSLFSQALHKYLFFRIPLVRPTRFLQATMPIVNVFYSRFFIGFVAVITLIGLYLISRQWENFIGTFSDFLSFEGAISFALGLTFIKIMHELGHAYTATRFGCRVPNMGVAFMVMFPMLYSDVTDAWRLQSRRERLLISAAGMIVELAIAGLSTFAWVFLPDGTLRGIAFVFASTSWILSLLVNLNPFMRFDGYYLASDLLGVSNLQPRAFAVGRWRLREILFNINHPPPEDLTRTMRMIITLYAWKTWIYRFFLFLGIALVVYHYFFKLLGIFLFAVEIAWFIAMPFWSELKAWVALRGDIMKSLRSYVTLSIGVALLVLFLLPISGRVNVPAIIEPVSFKRLYPASSAHIDKVNITEGQWVKKGEVLLEMSSPKITHQLAMARIQKATIQYRLSRAVADRLDREQVQTLKREMVAVDTSISGLKKHQDELIIKAPLSGHVNDMNKALHTGRWVSKREHIATVVADKGYVARGYVLGADLNRIATGETGNFIPDEVELSPVKVEVSEVAYSGVSTIELPYLASSFGGRVKVRPLGKNKYAPVEANYLVTMHISNLPNGKRVTRGLAHINGVPESIATKFWRQTIRVLVRESGA